MEITKEVVQEAYEKTALKPIRKLWVGYDSAITKNTVTCACGLSAVYAAQTSVDELKELMRRGFVTDTLKEKLAISEDFICGFMDAFDGNDSYKAGTEDYKKGRKVGEESVELLFGVPKGES
jgi:hypothetical protein